MAQVIFIPARLASTRLPRKALLDETGWPLIRHVYARCSEVSGVSRVLVATDADEIVRAVEGFGGEVVMTDPELPSGTDRVAEAARSLGLDPERDAIVNVQGDEPQIDPAHVEELFRLLAEDDDAAVATLAVPRRDPEGFQDPNRVKVVLDAQGYALYFSRAGIPFPRGESGGEWLCHVGIYGFRPGALDLFRQTAPTSLERLERLEQLRFLELGLRIRVGIVDRAAPGIDTPEDYRRFVEEIRGA